MTGDHTCGVNLQVFESCTVSKSTMHMRWHHSRCRVFRVRDNIRVNTVEFGSFQVYMGELPNLDSSRRYSCLPQPRVGWRQSTGEQNKLLWDKHNLFGCDMDRNIRIAIYPLYGLIHNKISSTLCRGFGSSPHRHRQAWNVLEHWEVQALWEKKRKTFLYTIHLFQESSQASSYSNSSSSINPRQMSRIAKPHLAHCAKIRVTAW